MNLALIVTILMVPARSPERLTVYDGHITPTPIMSGVALTESDGLDRATGDKGKSKGRFQLHQDWYNERVKKWGKFNPREPLDAARIASLILEENRAILAPILDDIRSKFHGVPRDHFGLNDWTIASYRQGVAGVAKYGPSWWYIDQVYANSKRG